MQKAITAAFSGLGIAILILDGRTALSGAASGVDLCMNAVIPSLFPFLFLCSILTGTLWGSNFRLFRPLCRRLRIPKGAESILIAALLGGYPAGAQSIGQAFHEKRLSKEQATYLLTFCNNAGPAFLFGMTAMHFSDLKTVWVLWIIHIYSALLTGMLFAPSEETSASLSLKKTSIPEILTASVKTMAILCGWIILFRIITEYFNRWFLWYFSDPFQVMIVGLLELSNGCCALKYIEDASFRFVVCTCLLSFGGLCVLMQTSSVLHGLSLRSYLWGKLIQTIVSLLISFLYLRFGWMSLLFPLIPLFLPSEKKIEVDFPANPLYNLLIKPRRKKEHAVS